MDDLISRQKAIMHFVKVSKNYECGMFDLKEVTHELWQLPSAQPKGWLEQNKDEILQAGMEGREIDFYIGGRLFTIREKAQ